MPKTTTYAVAKYDSKCPVCTTIIRKGSTMGVHHNKWCHIACCTELKDQQGLYQDYIEQGKVQAPKEQIKQDFDPLF